MEILRFAQDDKQVRLGCVGHSNATPCKRRKTESRGGSKEVTAAGFLYRSAI